MLHVARCTRLVRVDSVVRYARVQGEEGGLNEGVNVERELGSTEVNHHALIRTVEPNGRDVAVDDVLKRHACAPRPNREMA